MKNLIRHILMIMALTTLTWSIQAQNQDSTSVNRGENLNEILDPEGFVNNLPDRAEKMSNYLLEDLKKEDQTPLRHHLFKVVFFVILIYIILIVLLPLFIEFYNAIMNFRIKRLHKKLLYLQEKIIHSVLEDQTGKPCPNYPKNKLILSLFYELGSYLEGTDRDKLNALFSKCALENFAHQRLNRPFTNKAIYLRYISIFPLSRQTMDVIEECAHDANAETRLYAMMILIKRNPERIITLFSNYPYELSQWEQLQYYDFFVTNEIALPMFHPLTLSRNDTIAMFALRMIRMFHQKRGSIEGYESLLSHSNPYVQAEMFRTLFSLGYPNLKEITKSLFEIAPLNIKLHIISFIAEGEQTTIPQMMEFFNDNSIDIQKHVLESIFNSVEGGKEFIRSLAESTEEGKAEILSRNLLHKAV